VDDDASWLFGYGSVIYRPSFPFVERRAATLHGYRRRFSQLSDDHRGTPEAPGRVVTLHESEGARVRGVAYRLDAAAARAILAELDVREKAGYVRRGIHIELDDGRAAPALSYIAPPGNGWDAGAETIETIAARIAASNGPSGSNVDYLLHLRDALRELEEEDAHVEELAARVSRLLMPGGAVG
jgi:glutathione-specific gamma-glutamylcyclotransferase